MLLIDLLQNRVRYLIRLLDHGPVRNIDDGCVEPIRLFNKLPGVITVWSCQGHVLTSHDGDVQVSRLYYVIYYTDESWNRLHRLYDDVVRRLLVKDPHRNDLHVLQLGKSQLFTNGFLKPEHALYGQWYPVVVFEYSGLDLEEVNQTLVEALIHQNNLNHTG